MKQDKLIKKLKNLLARAEDNCNENEALIAARQLHVLLAKHNLSMTDLTGEEDPVGEDQFVSDCRPWKRLVCGAVARLYFCKYYYMRWGNKANMVFVGSESNRTFAMFIAKMIVTTIEKESRRESRKIYGKENCGFVSSFWAGAQRRICQRCEELIERAKEGTLEDEEGTTLPAMLSLYEQEELRLDDFMSSLNITTKSARTKIHNPEGFNKGKAAGDRVQLSRALQGKAAPKQIGNS